MHTLVRYISDAQRYLITSTSRVVHSLNVMSDYNFGTQTPCTQEEFDAAIDGKVYSSCDLNDKTFYFVYGEDTGIAENPAVHKIILTCYDKQKGVRITSGRTCFFRAAAKTEKSEAISTHTFLVMNGPGAQLVSFTDNWDRSSVIDIDTTLSNFNGLSKVLRGLQSANAQTSVQKNGLCRIREGLEGDFSLTSREGEVINVHKAVVAPLWPFFDALVKSEMKETKENEVKFDIPKSTLEVIVRYLYGQDLGLEFSDAARLVVAAQMYDLSELLEISVKQVTLSSMTLEQAIFAWKLGFEAKNDKIRTHCAEEVHSMMSDCNDFADKVDELTKEELQYLMHDLAFAIKNYQPSMGPKEERKSSKGRRKIRSSDIIRAR